MTSTAFTIIGTIVLIVMILAFIGCIIAQLRLSRKSPSRKGWIAPAAWFIFALFVAATSAVSAFTFFRIFVMYNVPTMILAAIYLIGCQRNNQKKLLQKMSIQDL